MNIWGHTLAYRLNLMLASLRSNRKLVARPTQDCLGLASPASVSGLDQAAACRASLETKGPWAVAACTLVGSRHASHGRPCEDTAAWRTWLDGALHAVVADGVSSGARGDVASLALARHVLNMAPGNRLPAALSASSFQATTYACAGDSIRHQLGAADSTVQAALAGAAPGCSGAATFAAIWVDSQGVGWFSRVGDCRLYLWRVQVAAAGAVDLILTQAIHDQTFAALGERAPPGVPPHNPARMVGNGHMGAPEVREVRLGPGDGVLLCSDGLHDVLTVEQLRSILSRGLARGRTPQALARLLTRFARRKGGVDDVGVVVLRYQPATRRVAAPTIWS